MLLSIPNGFPLFKRIIIKILMIYRGAVIDLATWIIIFESLGLSGFLAYFMKWDLRPI